MSEVSQLFVSINDKYYSLIKILLCFVVHVNIIDTHTSVSLFLILKYTTFSIHQFTTQALPVYQINLI